MPGPPALCRRVFVFWPARRQGNGQTSNIQVNFRRAWSLDVLVYLNP